MRSPTQLRRAEARAAVGGLMVLCQTDRASALAAVGDAMDEALANGWDEVRLALLHVLVVEAQTRDPAASLPIIADLQAEANRLSMKAMEAIALVDRIATSRLLGGQEPYHAYAVARALLSDREQPSVDRLSGLINLSGEFEMIGLIQIADETLAEATEAAAQMANSGEPLAVIAHNRVGALLRRVMGSVMVGDLERARKLFREYASVATSLDPSHIPDSWLARLDSYRRVVEVVLDDTELTSAEADELCERLSSRDSVTATMVRSVTPLATWPAGMELSDANLDPADEEQVRFLRLRAERRAGVSAERYLPELEKFNALVVARAEKARSELEAGIAAMITAELMSDEHGQLEAQARTDQLTGLANRRAFEEAMRRDDSGATTLMLFDLDDFKQINDTYGHKAGDSVLAGIATHLRDAAAPFEPDVVARIGGDEFAVILPGERTADASLIAQAMIRSLDHADWKPLARRPSASVGIAASAERSAVFELADANLYSRKRQRKARS